MILYIFYCIDYNTLTHIFVIVYILKYQHMIPKVEFIYNTEYDKVFRNLWYTSDDMEMEYISDKIDINKHIEDKILPMWDKYWTSILEKLEEIWIYKWTETKITFYIIGTAKKLWSWTAIPLTIGINNKKRMFDTIVHELIHYYLILWWNNIKNYYKHMAEIYNLWDIDWDSHFLLYPIQNFIYSDFPELREASLDKLKGDKYEYYLNKASEIWFDRIIEDYQIFIKNTEQEIYEHDYPFLRYKSSASYSKVFENLEKDQTKKDNYTKKWTNANIQNFINKEINTNHRKLYQIPRVICKLTNIQSPYKFFYINLVPDDPYDINTPMTIWLYENEDKLAELTIKKIVKYFIYFHKEQLQIYLKDNNMNEEEFEIHVTEQIKKELNI